MRDRCIKKIKPRLTDQGFVEESDFSFTILAAAVAREALAREPVRRVLLAVVPKGQGTSDRSV